MHQIDSYDILIFDCDGVILDSNELKINAMEIALSNSGCDSQMVSVFSSLFRKNFGMSRFHHVSTFSQLCNEGKDWEHRVLDEYSSKCRELYRRAELTPGLLEFLSSNKSKKYVASGSEQSELRAVFDEKGLSEYFVNIYGSPKTKSKIVGEIISNNCEGTFLMIGDALSDYEAANDNAIDFLCYIPFSNVKSELKCLADENGFDIVENWSELC